LLKLSYQLDRHYLGGLSVGRWVVLAGLIIVVVGLLPKVRLPLVVVIPAGAIAALMLTLLIWGRVSHYCRFSPDQAWGGAPADAAPMCGPEHVRVRASGKFAVEGRELFFADLEAIYHTFDTREHAVMAFVPRSRFLLLAHSEQECKGMWYIFIRPAQIEKIEAGRLAYGAQVKPAVRIVYRGEKRLEEACVACYNEGDLRKIAGDLRYDREEHRA